jgi:quercetin dioxygenase-like cupin family protein
MRRIFLYGAVLMLAVVGAAWGEDAAAPASPHVMTAPSDLKWGDPPPIFEKGASFTVVSGDPSQPGLYVVRLKMPKGYVIAPHWHPTDEHVTVLSGTFALGMGEKFDKKAMTELPVGGYALLPAEMRHYAMAKTEATVQVHGMGPFKLTYVNPADDPSQRSSEKAE